MTKFEKRILSGVQPTGHLHLGNYLGAIRKFSSFQEIHDCMYCIVDLHAITVWQDPEQLTNSIRETAAAFLAAGVDPENHIIFNQSQVGQHAQLAWIFNCIARMGWLNRMTQFKEKAGKNRENASVGLFSYPGLMAADILLYKATHVPVGDDQKQHLELTRDIAAKFNGDFSDRIAKLNYEPAYFPMIEPVISGPVTRVMSLRDGTKKMSKSDPSDLSRINLTDDADTIVKKIRKAKTDMESLPTNVRELEGRPEVNNLAGIYAALDDSDKQTVLTRFGNRPFSAFKPALAELIVEKLAPVNARMREYLSNPDHIDTILTDGADRAREIARTHIREIYEIFGFISKK